MISILGASGDPPDASSVVADRERIIEALSRLTATALDNARSYEVQRTRTRILAATAHELRSTLQISMLAAATLDRTLQGYEAELTETILTSLRWMNRLVRNAMDLSSAESNERAVLEHFDPHALVTKHLSAYPVMLAQRELELRIVNRVEGSTVRSVSDWLRIALDNLLNNAMRHARRGTRIELSLDRRPDAGPDRSAIPSQGHLFGRRPPLCAKGDVDYLEIAVHDFGPAIPESLRDRVFGDWVSGRDADGGHGLGLGIVAECITQLGGRVWLSSSNDAGTRFSISIPFDVNEA